MQEDAVASGDAMRCFGSLAECNFLQAQQAWVPQTAAKRAPGKAVKQSPKRPKVSRCGECHTCRNKHLKKVFFMLIKSGQSTHMTPDDSSSHIDYTDGSHSASLL